MYIRIILILKHKVYLVYNIHVIPRHRDMPTSIEALNSYYVREFLKLPILCKIDKGPGF